MKWQIEPAVMGRKGRVRQPVAVTAGSLDGFALGIWLAR